MFAFFGVLSSCLDVVLVLAMLKKNKTIVEVKKHIDYKSRYI